MNFEIIRPKFNIVSPPPADEVMKKIEYSGRICTGTTDKAGEDPDGFVSRLIQRGHESVLEHVCVTVDFKIMRSTAMQLIRHRLCSYSEESQRYVDYDVCCPFVSPEWFSTLDSEVFVGSPSYIFYEDCKISAENYRRLRKAGLRKEQARLVLGNTAATVLRATANIRQWRHILKLRTAEGADPEMKRIMRPLLSEFMKLYPVLFRDIADNAE